MKANGSRYVVLAFAVIGAYVVYQIWFNETRKVQRRLGEVAAALSAPEHEPQVGRLGRIARLRPLLAPDIRIQAGESGPKIESRDAILAALGAWAPPASGIDVQFVDVQVKVDGASARAILSVEVNTRDERSGQPARDTTDAVATLEKRRDDWVVTSATFRENPTRP